MQSNAWRSGLRLTWGRWALPHHTCVDNHLAFVEFLGPQATAIRSAHCLRLVALHLEHDPDIVDATDHGSGQNLQGRHAEMRAQNDYEVNMHSEAKIELLLTMMERHQAILDSILEHIRIDVPTAIDAITRHPRQTRQQPEMWRMRATSGTASIVNRVQQESMIRTILRNAQSCQRASSVVVLIPNRWSTIVDCGAGRRPHGKRYRENCATFRTVGGFDSTAWQTGQPMRQSQPKSYACRDCVAG